MSSSSTDWWPCGMTGSGIQQPTQILDAQPLRVGVARVAEPGRAKRRIGPRLAAPPVHDRLHDQEIPGIASSTRVVRADHFLMELLAGADADDLNSSLRSNGGRQVQQSHARNSGHEELASGHGGDHSDHELDALIDRDPETRHALIGDRDDPGGRDTLEICDDAAAAADHVAVPDDGKSRWASSRICVRGDEEFVAHELRGAVEIDGAGGLVRAQRDDPLNLAIKGRIDDVLCAVDVCLDGLEGVVLGGRNLFERGGMDDDVNAVERPGQPLTISHVADEEPQPRIGPDLLLELVLLEFVTAEYDDSPRRMPLEDRLDEGASERACAARDQDGLPVQHAFLAWLHDALCAISSTSCRLYISRE